MPADTKITPARIKRLAALQEAGASAREIADELAVDQRTARRWMKERGLEPQGKPGPHRARRKATGTKAAGAPVGVQDLATRVAKAEADLHAPGAARNVLRARLAEISTMVDIAKKGIEDGTGSIQTYRHMLALEREAAREYHALEPEPEKNPDLDPMNNDAADRLLTKFRKLVTRAEAETVCQYCGRPPF